MKLLSGYEHFPLEGTDSEVGMIVKGDRPRISYDIGGLAGDYVKSLKPDFVIWKKDQMINDRPIRIAKTKDGRIIVTLPGEGPANFQSPTKTEEDVTDLLLMAVTYSHPRMKR